jgi:uncharacterized protein
MKLDWKNSHLNSETIGLKERNPMLSPAINRTWVDSQGRAEAIAIYRIHETEMSGRTTDGVSSR